MCLCMCVCVCMCVYVCVHVCSPMFGFRFYRTWLTTCSSRRRPTWLCSMTSSLVTLSAHVNLLYVWLPWDRIWRERLWSSSPFSKTLINTGCITCCGATAKELQPMLPPQGMLIIPPAPSPGIVIASLPSLSLLPSLLSSSLSFPPPVLCLPPYCGFFFFYICHHSNWCTPYG